MVCRREAGGCGYEFCWVCLGKWSEHIDDYVIVNNGNLETTWGQIEEGIKLL